MNDDIIKNVTLEKLEHYKVVEYEVPLVLPKFRGSTPAAFLLGTLPAALIIKFTQPSLGYVLAIGFLSYPLVYLISALVRRWRAEKSFKMVGLENNLGVYIGGVELRGFLDEHGIDPEASNYYDDDDDATACTIGWSETEQAYYGWSHRAQRGFAIGDRSLDGETEIQSREDARSSAVAFAGSVS